MRAYGIPNVIVSLIENDYTGILANLELKADGCTEVFEILAGAL